MSRPNLHVGARDWMPENSVDYRYGIFVEPPASVSLPVLGLMRAAEELYGFHAARAYPPHITLIGSIVLETSEESLIQTITQALEDQQAINVFGDDLEAPIGAAVGIDYNRNSDGSPNDAFGELYERLRLATVGDRGFQASDRKAVERLAKEGREFFRAHLTVLGHDGIDNPSLRDEAKQLLQSMVDEVPSSWTGDRVTLYRFWSADWSGRYWLTQEWIPLRSWTLKSV